MLIDRFNRRVTGVRVSLLPSSNCNFRCIFCHGEGLFEDTGRLITADEIERVVRILKQSGIETVKLTGGEPMMRTDIVEIVHRLGQLSLKDLSMTTNGTKLAEFAGILKNAGLKRINISLHSLQPDRYRLITQHITLKEVLDAIDLSLEVGLTPVKLNVVLMRGINDDEIESLIDFVSRKRMGEKLVLQLIELVNEGQAHDNQFYNKAYFDLNASEVSLRMRAVNETLRELHFRRRYLLQNGVWVEVVKPMHNSVFCMGDNRMRITHDGKFKPCLLRHDNHVDFLEPLRHGASDEELGELFKKAVQMREPFFRPEIIHPR